MEKKAISISSAGRTDDQIAGMRVSRKRSKTAFRVRHVAHAVAFACRRTTWNDDCRRRDSARRFHVRELKLIDYGSVRCRIHESDVVWQLREFPQTSTGKPDRPDQRIVPGADKALNDTSTNPGREFPGDNVVTRSIELKFSALNSSSSTFTAKCSSRYATSSSIPVESTTPTREATRHPSVPAFVKHEVLHDELPYCL